MRRSLYATIAALALAIAAQPVPGLGEGLPWRDGARVVFLGDSITQAGLFVQDIEAYLFTRFPDHRYELINHGLSGETASGLTEPGDPYHRPNVHQRLGRVLQKTRPDLVVVCYGMNDGLYQPPGPDRLAAYQQGIEKIVERVKLAGAEVILATPPPFDPRPIAKILQPLGARKYDFGHPYKDYDDVLEEYGRWLLSKQAEGWKVVDVHNEVKQFVTSIRELDPGFTVAPDGVHPNATGHWLIAQAFLKAWNAPSEVDSAKIDNRTLKSSAGNVRSITRNGDSLRFSWITRIPMPHDPLWDHRLADGANIDDRFNQHRVTVTGLATTESASSNRYLLLEGDQKIRSVSVEQLNSIDLLGYRALSTNRRAAELRGLVADRQMILASAWLEAVGRPPPGSPKVLPLPEARKLSRVLEARIRQLARPVPIELRLEPWPGG